MSRGQYSTAVDMWSVGCIMGELLQRVLVAGKRPVPALRIAPLFQVYGERGGPVTPQPGDTFDGNGNTNNGEALHLTLILPPGGNVHSTPLAGDTITRAELSALFDVIGTPSWACVDDAVMDPSWRRYLRRLGGRASRLHERFADAGVEAVDLLTRLLAFDPSRRCSAQEALAHEYFARLAQAEPELADAAWGEVARARLQRLRAERPSVARRLSVIDNAVLEAYQVSHPRGVGGGNDKRVEANPVGMMMGNAEVLRRLLTEEVEQVAQVVQVMGKKATGGDHERDNRGQKREGSIDLYPGGGGNLSSQRRWDAAGGVMIPSLASLAIQVDNGQGLLPAGRHGEWMGTGLLPRMGEGAWGVAAGDGREGDAIRRQQLR